MWLGITAIALAGWYLLFRGASGSPSGWLEVPNPPNDTSACFPCGPWRYQSSKGQLWYVYLVINEWGASKQPTTNDKDIIVRASSGKELVAKLEA